MKRTTIFADEDLLEEIRDISKNEKKSIAEVMREAMQNYIRIKKPDLYYEFGAGLDFYLPYFKMSVELKMSNGVSDVLIKEYDPRHPEYGNAIEKMKSQIWVLSFHFE